MTTPAFVRNFGMALTAALVLASLVPARAAEPYDIYVILPLTGFAAYPGQTIAKVIGIVEEEANKQGGIHGRPVHFVIQDDQSSPQVAVQLSRTRSSRRGKSCSSSSGQGNLRDALGASAAGQRRLRSIGASRRSRLAAGRYSYMFTTYARYG